MRATTVLLGILLLAPLAHALAVSYPYFDDNTVKLHKGETYYYPINVQNEADTPITALVTIRSDIATLLGQDTIDLDPKSFGTIVYANITVPMDAAVGTTYNVAFDVAPAPSQPREGQVPFAVSYGRSVTVLVVEGEAQPATPPDVPVQRPTATGLSWPLIALLAIAVLIVAALIGRASRGIARRKP